MVAEAEKRAELGLVPRRQRGDGEPGSTAGRMTAIRGEIDRAREDLEVALGDLEVAARSLATTEHWKQVAVRAFRRRPGTFLAVAALAGFWMGRPRRRPRDGRG